MLQKIKASLLFVKRTQPTTLSGWFLYVVGSLSLTIGIIGAFTPVLPTVPFLILSSICYAKSSKASYELLLKMPVFGKMLVAWEHDRVIPIHAKKKAIFMMGCSFVMTYILIDKLFVLVVVACIMIVVSTFIILWPSEKKTEDLVEENSK